MAMAIGPNVVDDCEGMTEEDYWRGMDEAMQDEEGDAVQSPWQPMKTAPKDGTTVLALLESSDVPKAIEWCEADHFLATDGAGWYMPWDGTKIQPHDGPRYWMHCPDDPDDDGELEDA